MSGWVVAVVVTDGERVISSVSQVEMVKWPPPTKTSPFHSPHHLHITALPLPPTPRYTLLALGWFHWLPPLQTHLILQIVEEKLSTYSLWRHLNHNRVPDPLVYKMPIVWCANLDISKGWPKSRTAALHLPVARTYAAVARSASGC